MFEPPLTTKVNVTTKCPAVTANALQYLELAEKAKRGLCTHVHINP